jgi:hypothetical protein
MKRVLLLVTVVAGLVLVASQLGYAGGALPAPTNVSCQGYEEDTVVVRWKDEASDETNYRVERKIGNGSWSQVATMSPDGDGKYDAYRDEGADVSQPNRRYRIRAYRSSDDSFSPYSAVCNNRRIAETDDFRIFYGIEGSDDCPAIDGNDVCLTDDEVSGENKYITLQKEALQGSVEAFERLGFTNTAGNPPDDLDKVPINVVWCDSGGCAGGGGLGLSPLLLEKPFDLVARTGDPAAWIVAEHEVWHFQQYQYWGIDDPNYKWVLEGQARSSQDKVCIGADRSDCVHTDDIDTGYAGYVPEVKAYLGNTNRPIIETSYSAALFWTYLVDHYGTSNNSDDVEHGTDLFVKFWEASADEPGQDGIGILNDALADLGHGETFRDVWKDFAVASYAKDISGSGVPGKYKYRDMSEPGGNYGPVATTLSVSVGPGDQYVDTDNTLQPWGAVYYELMPDPLVPTIDIAITQDSTGPVYYTVLGIKGNNLVYEYNQESRHFEHTVANDSFDRVVLVMAGLEQLANYRYSFNGTEPTLNILTPTTANKARVGSPDSPDKFMVQVEVIDAEGAPLEGVNLDSFNFQVGSETVADEHVVAQSTVMGQHWFVLRAPEQEPSVVYADLTVSYGAALTDSEADAVHYQPRDDADSVLVVDRSGSMGSFEKLEAAQSAARLYVDSWRNPDEIGVIGFNNTPSVLLSLRPWTDSPGGGSRQDAFDAIDGMTATGGTAIGDSLLAGWQELQDDGNADHDWGLVLLSDGAETTGSTTFEDAVKQIDDSTEQTPVIHSVAVGPDADRPLMQWAASRTGGTYQYVSVPAAGEGESAIESSATVTSTLFTTAGPEVIDSSHLDLNLAARYRAIATDLIGQQQFFSFVGPSNNASDYFESVPIDVEGSAGELVVSISWDPDELVLPTSFTLRMPSSVVVSPTNQDATHRLWRITNPVPGEWHLEIEAEPIGFQSNPPAPEAAPWLPSFFIQGSLRSDVTMDVFLTTPAEDRLPGAHMPIVASLTDTGPISGADVVANVERPNGSTSSLTLYDDGLHGDGQADDGVYANVFATTSLSGSYNVTVQAEGTSPLAGAFVREKLLSFHILSVDESGGDTDGDGIPNWWEVEWGTNPTVPDSGQDPDGDGETNQEEYEQGTDPFDPDSDDDGEQDGTDWFPLDPLGPFIEPTYARAYPGDEKVGLKFVVRDHYTDTIVYRGPSAEGPFTQIDVLTYPIDNIYIDDGLTNGTTYCYTLVPSRQWFIYLTPPLPPIPVTSIATPSTPTCATPRGDNVPPHGLVLINDGEESTTSRLVRLTLWATDEEDPEAEILEGGLPELESSTSGVTQMMISNHADMSGGVWEPYATSKWWNLEHPADGLAAVYVKYRDAAGNESDIYPATIHIEGVGYTLRLPVMIGD